MFNKEEPQKATDVKNRIGELTEALEKLLKSYTNDAQDEIDMARTKAKSLLKQTRNQSKGDKNSKSLVCDAGQYMKQLVQESPWLSASVIAVLAIAAGILLRRK